MVETVWKRLDETKEKTKYLPNCSESEPVVYHFSGTIWKN